MTKQEFIATSLPHDLKAIHKNKHIHTVDHYLYQYICDAGEDSDLDKFKLILHPISDLTKPIEHDGEVFVPMIKLAEIASGEAGWIINDSTVDAIKYISADTFYLFSFAKGFLSFEYMLWSDDDCLIPDKKCNQFGLVQQLIKWKFDIANLIEKGEAIDINTLENFKY